MPGPDKQTKLFSPLSRDYYFDKKILPIWEDFLRSIHNCVNIGYWHSSVLTCRITIDVLQKSEVTKPSLLTNDIKMLKESCRQRETQEQKRIVRCQDSEF